MLGTTRYRRASRLASRKEEADHLSPFSLSAPFSPAAMFLLADESGSPPPHTSLFSLSSAPGSGLQGLLEGQVLVAFFGFQTSKNGSPGEQWPDHLRDVNCVRNVTRRAFKNTTRDFIVTNRDGWQVWSHLSRKSLCQAWDLKKKKKANELGSSESLVLSREQITWERSWDLICICALLR